MCSLSRLVHASPCQLLHKMLNMNAAYLCYEKHPICVHAFL